jgi:protein TonB
MGARMFEDLVLSSPAAVRRPGLSWPLSIVIHAFALALLLLIATVSPGDAPPPLTEVLRIPDFWRPPAPPPEPVRPAIVHPRTTPTRPGGPAAIVPVVVPGPPPPIDAPPGPPTDDAPPPCLHECEGTVRGGETDGVIGDDSRPGPGPAPGAAPVRIHRGIKPPVRIAYVAPAYPAIAITAHVAGTVILDCTIAEDGRVVDVRVLAGHPLFTPAAVDAVRQWRYTPTLLNGVPVPVLMTVTVRFSPAK